MAKFRKKPVEIEAWQVPPEGEMFSEDAIFAFSGSPCEVESNPDGSVSIHTLEGSMLAVPGDWIIKGVQGELYPCKPDIFKATYERVDD